MKHIILGVLLLVVVGAGIYGTFQNKPVEVMNEKPVVVEETTPDCMTVLSDEDACKAAEGVIQRKKDEAELADIQAQIEALEVRETELEKALNVY